MSETEVLITVSDFFVQKSFPERRLCFSMWGLIVKWGAWGASALMGGGDVSRKS